MERAVSISGMKRLLFALLVLCFAKEVKAQVFTFECVCDYLTAADSNCDICSASIQSRLFKGILIRKSGVPYKWIDQPYIVQFQGNNATFRELIPNGETVTITLAGTPYGSIAEYQDSIKCPCAEGTGSVFVAGPGIVISGDTISAVDTSATNEAWTIDADDADTELIIAQTVKFQGGGINVTDYNPSTNTLLITGTEVDGSTTNELQTYSHSGTTSYTNTLSSGGGSFTLQAAGINAISHNGSGTVTITGTEVDGLLTNEGVLGVGVGGASSSTLLSNTSGANPVTINVAGILGITESTSTNGGSITITGTEVDGSTTNEIQTLSASGAGPTSYNIDLSLGGGSVTLAEGTGIDLTRSTNTITINNTGAAALSGVVNQIPYFNTISTITTPAGSGNDAMTWEPVNKYVGIGTVSPGQKLDVLTTGNTFIRTNSTSASGVTGFLMANATGTWGFRNQGNSGSDFWIRDDSGVLGTVLSISRSNGNTTIGQSATAGSKLGVCGNLAVGIGYYNTAAPTNGAIIQGAVGIGNNSPQRTLHVTGETRITDLTTDPPTVVLGADGDGDLGTLALSGMSISGGTLTATDGSTTNELQTIANTSDATSHTVTLSNSGGSVQLVEGSGVTLTTTGTSGAGVVTIAATGAGTDLSFSGASSPVTLNSSTGTDVTFTAGGINSFSASGTNITITGTEVDGNISNEGSLTVGAGSGTTSIINSNTSGSTGVTLSASTGLSISESGNVITLTNTAPDQTVSLTGAGITNITGTYPNFTITSTEVDGSTTNELQTISVASNTTTLSNSGGSMTIAGAGINTVGTAGSTITITGTEVDGSISNEGSLTVGAGSGTTSIINSNTSGSTGVTITASTGLTISETGNVITLANSAPDQTVSITNGGGISVSGTYPSFTLTATDQSATNEAQTLSVSGTTSGILSLNAISGVGGGTATIAAGTGITVGQSGGTITITNSSSATAGWLLDGNTIGAAKRIGSNDNFDVVVETNNTDRMWFDNAGTVSIGATQLTTAALNINGLQTGTGMLIAGGGSLTGPNFYTATGSGTGSTATILSGVVSMISGNVEALLKNTATAGTGGGSVITLNVSPTATSNDPFIKWQTEATTDWSMGIDNDDGDALKLHRFSRPSDNNGVGTIEFGYNSTSIGMTVNKTGILSGANFYGVDVLGKIRGDLFVNNVAVATGTVALGVSAGTSPTLDNTVTTWWGNGGRVKFTSGSSGLTANSTLFTITMNPNWKFINNGAPIVYASSASAAGIKTNASYVASTGVITCTLSGTLTASTSYEFNVSMTGN